MDSRLGLNVLLVEDNPGDVRLLQEYLRHQRRPSIVLHHVDRLASATEFVKQHGVDLILLDLSLPDSQGLDTFKVLHRLAQGVAIIILTGLDDEDLAVQAMQQGAQDYLLKGSADAELLRRSMRYAVERKRAEMALRKARDTLEIRVRERTSELARINEELRNEILERNRVERALRASEERYRGVVEDQTELIFRILPDQTLTFLNGACCRFFERKEHELLGRKLPELLGDGVAAQIRQSLISLGPDKSVGKIDLCIRPARGEPRWVQWTTRVIHGHSQGTVEYQWVGRDVTEEKRMEQALREGAENMKLFAYSIVHDLKSPAVALHGLVRLLQKHYGEVLDARGTGYCEQILKASEQISGLVEAINLYISTREAALMTEEIDLRQVLGMVRDEFAARLEERGVRWEEPLENPQITADRLALVRVFRNLVDNALKYGGSELTTIRIGYRSDTEFHVLSVTDDGSGICQEDSTRIFNLFQRRREAREAGVEGAGLGLAIVREIAEKHGGHVWVESSSRGTTFNVSLSKGL